jgi:probable FeS assembly SUF system protein SufT
VLPAGTKVTITHRLGGNFTVVCDSGMFRIKGTDAEALGEQVPSDATENEGKTDAYGSIGTAEHPGHAGKPSDEAVWDSLKKVFDPEIPVNIVDLGLVYSLKVDAIDGSTDRHSVVVAMTLTAPGCGMGPVIAEDARNRVLSVPGVNQAQVSIVWDPPWTQTMISEDGKMQLGLI